jgi:mitogen-activated protein kinase kinase kinase
MNPLKSTPPVLLLQAPGLKMSLFPSQVRLSIPWFADQFLILSILAFQYVLGEMIGKGSYARVYLALNASNGELFAIKRVELPQTVSDLADSRQREMVEALQFERETLKV